MMILEGLLAEGRFYGPLHIVLGGEFYGFHGVMAVPVTMDLGGVVQVTEIPFGKKRLSRCTLPVKVSHRDCC
jgi:hypothetical protein